MHLKQEKYLGIINELKTNKINKLVDLQNNFYISQ